MSAEQMQAVRHIARALHGLTKGEVQQQTAEEIYAAVAPLIAAAERERCARVADDCDLPWNSPTTEQHDNAILMAERIAAEVEALRAEVERLREALDFYACADHYPVHGAEAPDVVRNDGGKRARAALGDTP